MSLLDENGYAHATAVILQADASKHYTRLTGGPRPALLMRTPSAEYLASFLRVARHLAKLGIPAPGVIAVEAGSNTALVEDLGCASMAAALDAGADPAPLYFDAARSLVSLHAAPPPLGLPAWDAAAMTRATSATFCDWWWPASFGAPPAEGLRQSLAEALEAMLRPFPGMGFVHRDYFPANLIPTARGMAVIDFQDAATGHPAYDLVSLVEDARRDVAPTLREAVTSAYLAQRPGLNAEMFRAAMAVHAAQRHLRVAALWVRLERRDGKPYYLEHGPRCWALLARALEHPATTPLRRFLDAQVPLARRGNPV